MGVWLGGRLGRLGVFLLLSRLIFCFGEKVFALPRPIKRKSTARPSFFLSFLLSYTLKGHVDLHHQAESRVRKDAPPPGTPPPPPSPPLLAASLVYAAQSRIGLYERSFLHPAKREVVLAAITLVIFAISPLRVPCSHLSHGGLLNEGGLFIAVARGQRG